MKTLITGGAGFLGSHLAEALVQRGGEVVVIDNFRRGRLENFAAIRGDIEVIHGDVRDEDALGSCMTGVEVVFHLAAQSNVMGSLLDVDYSTATNVFGTVSVLKSAVNAGARRVVFASSREVYGDPPCLPVGEDAPLNPKNPYGASKVAAESYCNAWSDTYGLECQVLRFVNLFGPRDRDRVIPLWLQRAALGSEMELFGGRQVLDFLWVAQAVDALIAAADCQLTGPINVGSGLGVRLTDLAARIAQVTRTTSSLVIRPSRRVEVTRFVADTTRMQRLLGVIPELDPLQHLSEMIEPAWMPALKSA
jgi:UDP-glucose 4-epimerase